MKNEFDVNFSNKNYDEQDLYANSKIGLWLPNNNNKSCMSPPLDKQLPKLKKQNKSDGPNENRKYRRQIS